MSMNAWISAPKRGTGLLALALRDMHTLGFSARGRVVFGMEPRDSGHNAVEFWFGSTSDHG